MEPVAAVAAVAAVTTLASPALTRMRATVVATEATTSGLAAGLHLAFVLVAIQHLDTPVAFTRGGLVLAATMATLGLGWQLLVRHLRLGRSSDPDDPLWVSGLAGVTLSATLALIHAAILLVFWADWSKSSVALLATTPAPIAVIALSAYRAVAAVEGRSRTPLADLLLASSHTLLGGLAACLLIGLLSHTLTAENTYELGLGATMAALWTAVAAMRVLHVSRRFLRQETALGRRWPTSQGGVRSATIVLVLGVLAPATILVSALLSARLAGVELACVALAVSVHTMRYAMVTMRYGATATPPSSPNDSSSARDSSSTRDSSLSTGSTMATNGQDVAVK